MIRFQLSRVILWNGALSAIPALTTSSSIGPLMARASSNAARIRSRSVTSHGIAYPPTPSATACSGSIRRPSSDSLAPAAFRCAAAAAPMPVPPPVISACRPSSSFPMTQAWPNGIEVAMADAIHPRGPNHMKTRAAVAFGPKQPLEIVEVDLDGPKAGEVLVETTQNEQLNEAEDMLNGMAANEEGPADRSASPSNRSN